MDQFKHNIICAIVLCFAAHNEPLPYSIHDAIIHLNSTNLRHSLIPHLLSILVPSKHEIIRFLSSFPADVVIEKELSIMFLLFDENSGRELITLLDLFARCEFLAFLHPFILRGLGSALLHYQMKGVPASHLQASNFILLDRFLSASFENTIQLFLLFPSAQIVDFSLTILHYLDQAVLFEVFNEHERSPSLALITTLASHSLHTASVASLHRWFLVLHQLHLNPNRTTDDFQSVFGEVNQYLWSLHDKWNVADLGDESIELFLMSVHTELCFDENDFSILNNGTERKRICRDVPPALVSPIPARRNAALVLLSKVCERANCGMVVDMCRFGVVECVIAGVDVSSSLEEYEMGISILGSILRTLTLCFNRRDDLA
ncbi:hypothetical protein BLNAU_3020 [Blattamonas nauphoetae]|uniref:Uncharacterized protein n=1 Tax=Blattamonas nauphoetae TaxID=2049346 RepID=A0ABQ9YDW6_9EUKA|nr:hypothetical protein BLNAU_3020 [Blattamonas nauphoetae]